MSMKISKLQVMDPQYWGNLTREEHLGWMGVQEPQWISKVIDRVYEATYGADNIVSFIDRLPVRYLEDDTPFRWPLQGADERNYPLVKATMAPTMTAPQITDNDQAGLNYGRFYLWFGEDAFSVTSVIVGHHPEKWSLRVMRALEVGGYYVYEVQLVTGDPNMFVDASELEPNTRWSEDYGLVEQTMSIRGNSVKHSSPFVLENEFSVIRKQYEVPGNMIRKGKNPPMVFKFSPDGKKIFTAWISKLEWDFLTQFRRDKARLLMYGKSTKTPEGTYSMKGESNNVIKAGYGLIEQMNMGNTVYYNDFSLDHLTDVAMSITVGKVPEDKRNLIISTGEYGAYQLHKALVNRGAEISWLRSDHNFKTDGDKMILDEGQILEYRFINGIKFKLTIDPMKDDPVRNKITHPNGGLASSYIYDMFDFGTTEGKPNIQRVAVQGDEEIYRYIGGLRDPYIPYNNTSTPVPATSMVDGFTVMKWYQGGIQLNNPLKTVRLIPTILR